VRVCGGMHKCCLYACLFVGVSAYLRLCVCVCVRVSVFECSSGLCVEQLHVSRHDSYAVTVCLCAGVSVSCTCLFAGRVMQLGQKVFEFCSCTIAPITT